GARRGAQEGRVAAARRWRPPHLAEEQDRPARVLVAAAVVVGGPDMAPTPPTLGAPRGTRGAPPSTRCNSRAPTGRRARRRPPAARRPSPARRRRRSRR